MKIIALQKIMREKTRKENTDSKMKRTAEQGKKIKSKNNPFYREKSLSTAFSRSLRLEKT